MKEETLFEKLGVEYQEIDGIFYPILSVTTEDSQCGNVGKYGHMWIEHIKIIYPQRYRSLVRFGELKERAEMVNETAYELLEDIEVRWLDKHRPKNANSFVEQLLGVKQCALLIHDAVLNKFQVELDENLLNSYLMKGKADVDEEYLKFMEETAKTYVQNIFLKLKELGYNSKLMKLHFMGGGAKLVELFGEYEPVRVSFNHDICTNAKGFEYFCYLAMRKRKRA